MTHEQVTKLQGREFDAAVAKAMGLDAWEVRRINGSDWYESETDRTPKSLREYGADANADYSVLEWVRGQQQDAAIQIDFAHALNDLLLLRGGVAMLACYRIGDYGRALLLAANKEAK